LLSFAIMKLAIIIAINCFVSFVNSHNRFDKALTEIFQFRMALMITIALILLSNKASRSLVHGLIHVLSNEVTFFCYVIFKIPVIIIMLLMW